MRIKAETANFVSIVLSWRDLWRLLLNGYITNDDDMDEYSTIRIDLGN